MNIKMKKKVLRLAIGSAGLVGIAVPVAALVACGTSSTPEKAYTVSYASSYAYTYKGFDVSQKTLYTLLSDPENPRWQTAVTEFNKAGTEAKFKTNTVAIQKSLPDQRTALSTATADAYVVGASDDSDLAGTIGDKNRTQPTAPVVAYDRLIKAIYDNYDWYVTFDSQQVGRLQGLFLVNALYGSTFTEASVLDTDVVAWVKAHPLSKLNNVLALAGDPGDNNAKYFFNGAKDVLKLASDNDSNLKLASQWDFDEVAQIKWNYDTGRTKLQTNLNALSTSDRNAVTAVLAPNDRMAESVVAAVRAVGLDPTKVAISGLDAINESIIAIKNGTGQDMTVFKPDYALARTAVAVVAQLLKKKDSTVAEMTTALNSYFDTTDPSYKSFKIDDSGSVYKVEELDSNGAVVRTKAIKTVLLKPVMITSTNIDTYFKVSEAS